MCKLFDESVVVTKEPENEVGQYKSITATASERSQERGMLKKEYLKPLA